MQVSVKDLSLDPEGSPVVSPQTGGLRVVTSVVAELKRRHREHAKCKVQGDMCSGPVSFTAPTSSTRGQTMMQSVIARLVVSLRMLQTSLCWLASRSFPRSAKCRFPRNMLCPACCREGDQRLPFSAPVFCRAPSSHVGSGCCFSASGPSQVCDWSPPSYAGLSCF